MILPKEIMFKKIRFAVSTLALLLVVGELQAQNIPDSLNGVVYRGDAEVIARGVIDGNLIETNFRNHGELSRWSDLPWGVWPRTVGGRHIDGVGVIVAGYVDAAYSTRINSFQEYVDWVNAGSPPDTTLNPLIINYRDAGRRTSDYSEQIYGWLPLPGFNNPLREDPITLAAAPTPALSNDPTSWPEFWPDKLDEEDPGWPGTWNGRDGRFASADLESFYVMDDYSDWEYAWGLEDLSSDPGFQAGPHSPLGVYHPSPISDQTMGGFGLQMQVRLFQWANVLAEDTMFLIYRITNNGDYTQNRLLFAQIVDYGLGNEENDDNASFDDVQDVVFGWDSDGIGTPTSGGSNYNLGYTGFAFLESPSDQANGDNDQDGITDESRFDETFQLFTTLAEIQNYTASEYNLADFEIYYGEPVEERPAAEALRWFTSDENLDWVGYDDANENGVWDDGELLNNDVGRDGLGPFDLNYPGPDEGQGDGMPNNGEPNYNELDVDESDQIGLTGFDLDTRPVYESGDNLRDDTWLFGKIEEHLFSNPDYVAPSTVANDEPFILFVSGEVVLSSTNDPTGKSTDFFSTAWIFGEDEEDFFKNRRTVQNIYNADYNFAQPPIIPTLTAVGGDSQVILSWDTLSVGSFDRFLQEFDFEGYKIYKSTNNVFTDSRTITDVNGIPTFYDPIAQFDLDNGISGNRTVFDGEAVYNLGSDTGLKFFYVDNDVINGKTYYYSIVAYDRGTLPDPSTGAAGIDPQENTFRIAINFTGDVIGTSINSASVTPTTLPAGFIAGGATVDLSSVTEGSGTGYATINVVVDQELQEDLLYEVTFADTAAAGGDFRVTTTYSVTELTTDTEKIKNADYETTTSIVDGFTVNLFNASPGDIIESKTGYVSNEGTENETFGTDPTEMDGFSTDWEVTITPDDNGSTDNFLRTDNDYEILFVNPDDSTYRPPFRFGGGFSRFDIPIFVRNVNKGTLTDVFIKDNDDNDEMSPGDLFIISERDDLGRQKYKFSFEFTALGSSTPPSPGDKIRISTTRPFGGDDKFRFGVQQSTTSADSAKNQLSEIFVAPNPYIGAASWERASNSFGRGERKINFMNLPRECTIRIFNIRGELIKTIEHSGAYNEGSASWDLLTNNNEDVAYGVYFYHVEAPGIGEFKSKFAVVK